MVPGEPLSRSLVPLPDAALGHGHRRASGNLAATTGASLHPFVPDELPPDEEAGRENEENDRDPRVRPQAEEVAGRVDPEQLLEEAPEAVVGDVEREQPRRPDPEPR